MDIDFSLNEEKRGYANLINGKMTIFLLPLIDVFNHIHSTSFSSIEDVIEELVIHEKIHEITGIHDDWLIDGWHKLLCRLLSSSDKCDCPIDCFFRDVLCVKGD